MISWLILAIPQFVFASSLIVSTVKNPDPYSNNQSWFRYSEAPGKTIKDTIALRNLGDYTETVKLYGADATSNQAGSFIPKQESDDQVSLGKWIKLSKNQITLDPGQSSDVDFTIKVPEDASPGQYFGSIIKEEVIDSNCDNTNNDSKCRANIQIKTRTGNRVYLNIPGEIKQDIRLTNFTYQAGNNHHLIFKFSFVNNGNVAFEPKGVISIYDIFGKKIATINRDLGKSLPNSVIEPMVDWDSKNIFGQFTAKADVYYKQEDLGNFDNMHGTVLTDNKSLSFMIFPWEAFWLSMGIFTILGLTFMLKRHEYKKVLKESLEYTVGADENIIEIASKNNITWQSIAKLNHLKPPYILSEKQKLKIPRQK